MQPQIFAAQYDSDGKLMHSLEAALERYVELHAQQGQD